MTDKQKLLKALIEEPSRYSVDVNDNSILPENMKDKKSIYFVVKPPSPGVLAMCANLFQDLPKELLEENKKLSLQDVMPHLETMVKVICRISWGKKDDYPEWYLPFFMGNTTGIEIFKIFQETALKTQSDFFLTSFQIASLTNPMMMKKIPKKTNQIDSIPTDS
ncbi:hypothetical protein [Christiangramia forsetii]|nr:hypothetical protein [Christiangramia forsetii]